MELCGVPVWNAQCEIFHGYNSKKSRMCLNRSRIRSLKNERLFCFCVLFLWFCSVKSISVCLQTSCRERRTYWNYLGCHVRMLFVGAQTLDSYYFLKNSTKPDSSFVPSLPLTMLVCHHSRGPLRLRALSAALQHLEPIGLCWVSVVPGGLEVAAESGWLLLWPSGSMCPWLQNRLDC